MWCSVPSVWHFIFAIGNLCGYDRIITVGISHFSMQKDQIPKWVDLVPTTLRLSVHPFRSAFCSSDPFCTIYRVYKIGIMLLTEHLSKHTKSILILVGWCGGGDGVSSSMLNGLCYALVLWFVRLTSFIFDLKKRQIGMFYHDISSVLIGRL